LALASRLKVEEDLAQAAKYKAEAEKYKAEADNCNANVMGQLVGNILGQNAALVKDKGSGHIFEQQRLEITQDYACLDEYFYKNNNKKELSYTGSSSFDNGAFHCFQANVLFCSPSQSVDTMIPTKRI
jgi:hypothetical protein